jgi:hypothetical protein
LSLSGTYCFKGGAFKKKREVDKSWGVALEECRGVTTNEPFNKKFPAVHPLNKPANRLAWRLYNRFEKLMEIFLSVIDRQKIATTCK